jgi:hypothetical protein
MTTFDTTKTPLGDLLRDVVSGKIQLPDFQRGWVWDDEHIRSLLVSIARSFPIGAVMLLETGGDAKFKVRPVEGLDASALPPDRAEQLLLDGQQRLTSLTQVLMLKTPTETRDSKKKKLNRHYYINIEHALQSEEQIEDAIVGVDERRTLRKNFDRDIVLDLSSPEREYAEFYFPCDQILKSDEWESGLFAHQPQRFAEYMRFRGAVLDRFRTYHLPVIELKKENTKEAVCLVFEKVNTGGVPLSVFELVTATYAADGVNLRDEWFGNRAEKLVGVAERLGVHDLLKDVQPTDFLQGLTILHTLHRRDEDVASGRTGKQITGVSAKREAVLALPLAAYQAWKGPLVEGYLRAAHFLRKEAFYSRSDLPYRTQIVPLAAVLALTGDKWLEPRNYEKLARWYWCGVLGELYGGAVETRIALDVQNLIRWLNGDGDEPVTVADANFQRSRLSTLRTRNSAAYKGIHVLLQREGARDLFWKSTIRELEQHDWREHGIDIHHVFPVAWCTARGVPAKVYDSVLNKTPLSYKANRMIGGRAPSEYLRQLQDHANVQLNDTEMDALIRTHAIDPSYLRHDDMPSFLEDRAARLIERIETAMGKRVSKEGTDTDDADYAEPEWTAEASLLP